MYRPIRDYALIGDCHSAALISSAGAIDWLCLPHFDSPAVMLRLLDDQRGGFCDIAVAGTKSASRSYLPRTNILQTTFQSGSGELTVTDFMPVRQREAATEHGQDCDAEHRVVRWITCTTGEVELRVSVRPTFGFSQSRTELHRESSSAVFAHSNVSGPAGGLLIQLEGRQLEIAEGAVSSRVRLRAGESTVLVLTASQPEEAPRLVALADVRQSLERTRAYWEQWAAGCDYQGEYRDEILRSALALKLMTFEPTGAIVAAPTTSLPEAIGGERNWDYRFTWVRDATFTLIALMNLGYFGEARDFLHFLKRTVGPEQRFQILYRVDGRHEAREHNLDDLEGYRRSRPVRVGNGAVDQTQLDIFGELIHCVYLYAAHPETELAAHDFEAEFWPLVVACADFVCNHWREPDQGIWEMRGAPRQFVYSKGSCWLALDRAVRLAEHFGMTRNREPWKRERDALLESFNREGYDAQVGAFVQSYGSTALDASVLRLPIMGVVDAKDPRMQSTVRHIESRLMRNGLLYRYRIDDGMKGEEGAFAACGFWLVDNYVLSGRVEEARAAFEHLLSFANDVGLLAEEIDPDSGALLGNFPQAFTHIGLINAALRLAEARHHRKPTAHAIAEEETTLPEHKAA